jgi:hypothetical protein
MESFRWMSVILSMILGLGITRLLSTLVALFRSRRDVKGDWIPFAWAGCIFIQQLQFWWAIMELPSLIHEWTVWSFSLLVSLTLLLFAAAELILPPTVPSTKTDIMDAFERNGKWSLVALSAYFSLAVVTNWALWTVSPFTILGACMVVQIALLLTVVRSRVRKVQAVVTAVYVPIAVLGAAFLSRASY